jgi:serine protease
VTALLVSLLLAPQSFSQAPVSPGQNQGEGAANGGPKEKERPARPTHVPGELIVKFKPGADRPGFFGAHANLGVKEKRRLLLEDYAVITFPNDRALENVAEALRRHPAVESVEPNGYVYAEGDPIVPNDPQYGSQWHMPMIQMPSAWAVGNGSGVKVAVVDSGAAFEDYVDPATLVQFGRASDFAADTFLAGWDFTKDNTYPPGATPCGPARANDQHANDQTGHGTHVAGTIAQATNNGIGVAGVAYGAKIMPVKVLDCYGSGTYDDVVDGIKWAADQGAKVINLSLGGKDANSALEGAVNYAAGKGAVVVAASGNYQGLPGETWDVSYPAAYANAIAVGAVGITQAWASYSKYGPPLDLVAPGGDGIYGVLQQTFPSGSPMALGFYTMKGTSMATPHVSGVAALLLAHGNVSTPQQVRNALQSTALDLGPAGLDPQYGHGLIQAYEALQYQPPAPLANKVYLPLVARQEPAGAWTTVANQTFEGAFPLPDWETLDNTGSLNGEYYWAKRSCAGYESANSVWAVGGGAQGGQLGCGGQYPDNAESWLIYGPFSLAGATAADVSLKLWLDTELDNDGVLLGASTNGTLFTFPNGLSGNSQGWIDMSLDLSSVESLGNLLGQPSVWVAVLFSSNETVHKAVGAYVDNIVLRKCTSATCTGAGATGLSIGSNAGANLAPMAGWEMAVPW